LPDPVAFREHLAPFGVCPSDEECARAHYVGMAVIDELGTADFLQASRSIVRLFGVAEEVHEAASAAVDTAYKSSWVPVAGAGAQLRRLQAAGVSLAVVSNATGAVEAELAGHGICAVAGGCVGKGLPEVAVVIDSCVVGVEKPDPAIFSLALEVLDVAAERCMYVGDSVHFDVNGALAAGLHPVHLTAVAGCPGNHLHYRALSDFVDAFLGT
ncbi:MAG: HAD family hydrolase, partial [Nitrososphaerales archaeon]